MERYYDHMGDYMETLSVSKVHKSVEKPLKLVQQSVIPIDTSTSTCYNNYVIGKKE